MAKAGLVCPPRRKTAQDRSPEPQLGKRARAGLAEVTVMQGGPPGQNVPWNKEPLVRAPPEETSSRLGRQDLHRPPISGGRSGARLPTF